MKTPTVGKDSELGAVEWIGPDTSKEDAQRINEALQKKLDFLKKQ